MKKFLLIFLLISQLSYAQEFRVIYQPKGTSQTEEGYWISVDTEKTFRLMDIDLQFEKKKNDKYKDLTLHLNESNDLLQKRIDIQQNQLNNLYDQVGKSDGLWGKLGMFLLGAGAATLMAFSITKATK